MSGRSSSKELLAEAGRRKLEAFRKQKAQAKNPTRPAEPFKQGTQEFRQPRVEPSQLLGHQQQPIKDSCGPIPFGDAAKTSVEPEAAHTAQRNETARPAQNRPAVRKEESSNLSRNMPPPAPIFKKPPPLLQHTQRASFAKPPLWTATPVTVTGAESVGRASLLAQPAIQTESSNLKDHSVSKPELPVSLNASDSHTAQEDLPLSSPLPNGYAALSDSYLSPAKTDAGSQERSLRTEEEEKDSPSSRTASKSTISRFTNFFGRSTEREAAEEEGGESEVTQQGESYQKAAAASVPEPPASESPPESSNEMSSQRSGSQGRHGRVPSLNAWNTPVLVEDCHEFRNSTASTPLPADRDDQNASQGVLSSTVAVRDSSSEDLPNGKSNGFNFVPPEPKDPFLPPQWGSPKSSGNSCRDAEGSSGGGSGPAGNGLSDGKAAVKTQGSAPLHPHRSSNGGSFRKDASFAHLLEEQSRGESEQFLALQQHIDDLTQQKFELARGLEKQQQMAATLASENQRLLDDYNQQGQRLQQLRKELEQRSAEVGAQQRALAGLGGERDACRSAVQDASQRAEDLAAEVVALEEKYLKARSVELRAVRRAEEAVEDARKAQRQRASAAAECAELRATVAALQEEKRKWPELLQKASANAAARPAGTQETDEDAATASGEMMQTELSAKEAARKPTWDTVVKESEVARIIGNARKFSEGLPSAECDKQGIPELIHFLLPHRAYQGDASQEAAELAEEQKRVLGSIHGFIGLLEKEKRALLISLHAQQEQIRALQSNNSQLQGQLRAALPSTVQSHLEQSGAAHTLRTSPGGTQRRGAFGWIANVVAARRP